MHAYIHVYVHAYMDEWILSSLCGYMHACMYILQSPTVLKLVLVASPPPPPPNIEKIPTPMWKIANLRNKPINNANKAIVNNRKLVILFMHIWRHTAQKSFKFFTI